MIEMHRVLGPPLAHRAQRVDIAEHVGERNHRVDDPRIATAIHAGDLTAPAVQIADDVAHVFLGRDDLDPHDRFEELWRRLHNAFLEGRASGDFEGEDARVDIVIGAVGQLGLQVDDREAARTPFSVEERSPFSTPGTYSLGTEPPTTSFSNTKPEPGGNGSKWILTR